MFNISGMTTRVLVSPFRLHDLILYTLLSKNHSNMAKEQRMSVRVHPPLGTLSQLPDGLSQIPFGCYKT